MLETLNLAHKQRLAKKTKPFILKEGIMYKMGQDNRMHRCLTTFEAQIVLKKSYTKEWLEDILLKILLQKNLDARYWWLTLFKDIHDFCRSYVICS